MEGDDCVSRCGCGFDGVERWEYGWIGHGETGFPVVKLLICLLCESVDGGIFVQKLAFRMIADGQFANKDGIRLAVHQ